MPRPIRDFHGMIGQKRLRAYVEQQIAGAKACGEPCPSFLLAGPSGAGKTSIARAIANAYGTRMHTLRGRDLTTDDLLRVLREAEHADVLFIDEAHGLSKAAQEALLLLLDESKLPTKGGEESVADVTLLLATNRPGELVDALRSRLAVQPLAAYTLPELTEIARRAATGLGISITAQAARRLAEVAQGSPRVVGRLIEHARRHHVGAGEINQPMVERFLELAGIDPDGMSQLQRQYLAILARGERGCMSLEALVARLRVDAAFIRDEIEPWLFDRELVTLGSGGRVLTARGRERTRLLEAGTDRRTTEEGTWSK